MMTIFHFIHYTSLISVTIKLDMSTESLVFELFFHERVRVLKLGLTQLRVCSLGNYKTICWVLFLYHVLF